MRIQYKSTMKERTFPPALRASARALPPLRAERLLDQVRERVRYVHFSIPGRALRARELALRYLVLPCSLATPSSTARATSAS